MKRGRGGGPDPRPPLLGRWLVAFGLPPSRREDVLGDLEERFGQLHRDAGTLGAWLWYVHQALAFAWSGLPGRLSAVVGRGWDADSEGWAGWIRRETGLALRGLARSPGYSTVALGTLALGIGGAAAVVSVVDGVLLRPLPFPDPDRLVAVVDTSRGGAWWSSSPANALAWREGSRSLAGVAWAQADDGSVLVSREAREARLQRVSPGILDVLGVTPTLGRGFRESADEIGAPAAVLLSHAFWERLGADRSLVGESVVLDGTPHTVVGVLPPRALTSLFGAHDILVPRIFTEEEARSQARVLKIVARLAPGAEPEHAARELEALMGAAGATEGWGIRVVGLRERLVGAVRPTLLALLGAVGLVLAVVAVNVSNLLLARTSGRRGELATRAALGAGRVRLAAHVLTEAVVLALLGGLVGITGAVWGTDGLTALAPDALPRMDEVALDGRVLLVALGLSGVVGLLAGLAPAVWSARARDLSLEAGIRRVGGRPRAWLRSGLVAVEACLVLLLLATAGLAFQRFLELRSVDPGFPLSDRLVLRITLPESSHPTGAEVRDFFRGLSERARGLPGVVEAGIVSHPPLFGDDWSAYHIVESRPPPRPGEEPIGGMEVSSPGYFRALGLPLLEGRAFEPEDGLTSSPVVVVDEVMAERYWPEGSPLGDRVRISLEGPMAAWREVVGVVGAARYDLGSDPRPRLYLPDGPLSVDSGTRHLVVRTEPGRGEAVAPLLSAAVREMAPAVPVASLRSMEDAAARSVSRVRLQTFLLAAFGVLALVLGAVGVYGVVSYSVSRRTREMGLRMALGARRVDVLARVLGAALVPVAAGVVPALAAVPWLGRVLGEEVVPLTSGSVGVLGGVTALLFAAALAAALDPGLRATRVDPVEALRVD